MFYKKKLTLKDKLDFLEYLSFQIKADMSFEKTLIRYTENDSRKSYIIEYCRNTINDIQNGKYPADALLENGFITKLEYGILKNSQSNEDLYSSLISIININKNSMNNSNILESSFRSGLFMLSGVFLLIPYYKDELSSLYQSFGQMQNFTTDGSTPNVVVELPFLIKYWWSAFIAIGILIAIYQGIKFFINYLYKNHANLHYKFFKNRMYIDLISILKTFYQLQNSMGISNAYIALAKSSPNEYWANLFDEINFNLKQGGKASDVFVSQKGIIPLEVINCFIDADETGETKLYLNKALDYCESRNIEINQVIKEWSPTIINTIIYFIVGLLVVGLVKDITENGVLNVMSKM